MTLNPKTFIAVKTQNRTPNFESSLLPKLSAKLERWKLKCVPEQPHKKNKGPIQWSEVMSGTQILTIKEEDKKRDKTYKDGKWTDEKVCNSHTDHINLPYTARVYVCKYSCKEY